MTELTTCPTFTVTIYIGLRRGYDGDVVERARKGSELMTEHGIIFSAEMVLALLADRKSVTRRLSKRWLRAKAGDRLWVRETWRPSGQQQDVNITYAADRAQRFITAGNTNPEWTIPKAAATGNVSPLFMPRWASRILLECEEDARVERLQDISDIEARAEGMESCTPADQFRVLWDTLHTKPGERWSDNPKVVRLGRFRRLT
jgi:hypothetical protein